MIPYRAWVPFSLGLQRNSIPDVKCHDIGEFKMLEELNKKNGRITTLDLQKVLPLFKIQDEKDLSLLKDLLRDSLKQ